jgi:hypothetical protein
MRRTAGVAVCVLAASASAADVTVDRENKRAEVLVAVPEGRLVITLDPMTGLLVHCTNLYQLNRQSGARYYKLHNDTAAIAAVDPAILKSIAGKDRYFGGKGVDLYEPAMKILVETGAYRRYPEQAAFAAMPEPLNRAMTSTWEKFYREYWDREFNRLVADFKAMSAIGWSEALAKMQLYTGRKWKGEMYIVAAEGAGKSAFTAGRNISVGAPGPNNDAGFVHEGLHLILREEWALDPRIQRLMEGAAAGEPPYKRWQARYEQAVVASLDIIIRGLDRLAPEDKVVSNYFEGLRLGPMAPVVWPLVKAHTEHPGRPFEDLMLEIIRRTRE